MSNKNTSNTSENAEQEIETRRERAARSEIVLGSVTETGFSATPDNRYAWTKQGEVHQLNAVRLKRVNVMGCLLSTEQLATNSLLQELVTSDWFYYSLTGVAIQIK